MGFADGLIMGFKLIGIVCLLFFANEYVINAPRPMYSAEILKFDHGKLHLLGAVSLPRRYSSAARVTDLGHSKYFLSEAPEIPAVDQKEMYTLLDLAPEAPPAEVPAPNPDTIQ